MGLKARRAERTDASFGHALRLAVLKRECQVMIQKFSAGNGKARSIARCAAMLVIGIAAFSAESAQAKPKRNQNGIEYCLMKNDDKGGAAYIDRKIGPNACCYYEHQHGRVWAIVCIKCDKNWKNCKEDLAARRPDLSTGTGSSTRAPIGSNSGSGNRRVCCKLRGHYGERTQYRLTSRSVCLGRRGVPVGGKFCSKKSTPQPARICCRIRRSHALMSPQQCRARRGRQVSPKLCRKTGRPEYRRQRR